MKFWPTYLSILLIMTEPLSAGWNSAYLPTVSQALSTPTVIQWEQTVVDAIKNSWCSEEKARLLFESVIILQPRVCVEIGAFTGSCTLPMVAGLQYLKQGQAYIIDAWSNEDAIQGLPQGDPNTNWWATLDMPAIKRQFLHTMATWSFKPYVQVLHTSSREAVSQVPLIDFLHIDGNFSEQGALLDTELYLPKVTQGGYILLSNILVMIGGKPTKMKALWPLFEYCEIVCEIENGNAILFRKK